MKIDRKIILINLTPLLDLLFIVIFLLQIQIRKEAETRIQNKVDFEIERIKKETPISIKSIYEKEIAKLKEVIKNQIIEIEDQKAIFKNNITDSNILKENKKLVQENKKQKEIIQSKDKVIKRQTEEIFKITNTLLKNKKINSIQKDATLNYWIASKSIDSFYQPKLNTLIQKVEKNNIILNHKVKIFKDISALINQWILKASRLSTNNVDLILINTFSEVRNHNRQWVIFYSNYAQYIEKSITADQNNKQLNLEKKQLDEILKTLIQKDKEFFRKIGKTEEEIRKKYQIKLD